MSAEDFILWGASGHARVLADLISMRGGRIVALFDNDPAVVGPWPDVPLYHGNAGLKSWLAIVGSTLPSAAVAIGGSRGRDRCHIADMLTSRGMALPALVHPRSSVSATAMLSTGSQLLAGAIVGADAHVGRCAIVNTGAQVDHECRLEAGVHLAPGAILCGCVEVGAATLIGPGAVVVPRVRIGKNVIVGAGAVVTRDLPDNVVAWGSPARIIRENET